MAKPWVVVVFLLASLESVPLEAGPRELTFGLSLSPSPASGGRDSLLVTLDLGTEKVTSAVLGSGWGLRTRRGLPLGQEGLQAFSARGGAALLFARSGQVTSILSTEGSTLAFWDGNSHPDLLVARSLSVRDWGKRPSTQMMAYTPGLSPTGAIAPIPGSLKGNLVTLGSDAFLVVTTENDVDSLWRVSLTEPPRELYRSESSREALQLLGLRKNRAWLSLYPRGEGPPVAVRLVVCDPQTGKTTLVGPSPEAGFRYSRLFEAEGRWYVLATAGLSDSGSMKNLVYRIEANDQVTKTPIQFDFWYSEGVYTAQNRLLLFNSFGQEAIDGLVVDLATGATHRLKYPVDELVKLASTQKEPSP